MRLGVLLVCALVAGGPAFAQTCDPVLFFVNESNRPAREVHVESVETPAPLRVSHGMLQDRLRPGQTFRVGLLFAGTYAVRVVMADAAVVALRRVNVCRTPTIRITNTELRAR